MYLVDALSDSKIPDEDFLFFYENFNCIFTQYNFKEKYKIEAIFNNYIDLELFLKFLENAEGSNENLVSRLFKGTKIKEFNKKEEDNWKKFLTAIKVSNNLTVVPPWLSVNKDKEIIINPSLAFGTGHHQTTLGCINLLLEIKKNTNLELKISSILDIGTGSGILSIMSSRIFSCKVTGIDNDAEAIFQAKSNLKINSLTSSIEFMLSELDEVRGKFDLIIINISYEYIYSKFEILSSRFNDSVFILSGFLSDSFPNLNRLFIVKKFSIIYMIYHDNWITVALKRI